MMRPMTLWESGDSNGKVSLGNMFSRPERITATNKLNLRQVAFLTCRGGWPQAVNLDGIIALDQARDYYDAVVKQDINRVDGVNRDSTRVKQLMRSYARNQGAQASLSLIRQDMLTNDTEELSIETVNSYIKALKKIFVIEDMPAWNPNLRSKTAIRTSDTRYFVDPSIAAASLGVGPEDLLNDLNSFGLLFEALCVRDLRVFAQALDGEVYHYRDKSGLECDAVVHLRNGSYGLIEIKLGGDRRIEEGVLTLKDLASKIDTERMKEPSFLMILTAVGDYAYRRKDGVYIVPIGCLKN
jgi:predicted AAA+ superfamily ATPase